MGRGAAVAAVLPALLAAGLVVQGSAAAEPHAGDTTATLPTPSPTATAVPDPPPVEGPGLRRDDSSARRLEAAPPPRDGERPVPGGRGRDLGTGSTSHGASRANTDRLPPAPDPIVETAPPPARAGAAPEASLQACVDRELARRGLNGFGDPPATEYPGGTPVDAASVERYAYVLRRSPGIRTACEATTPFR